MSITLRELLQIPQLANTVVAGAGGLDRSVAWAHACEMPVPWDWVGPGELLMTIGHCVPRRAAEQVVFVRRLARAGLAGIAMAEGKQPLLTKALRNTADELDFRC